MSDAVNSVLDGNDLILSVGDDALGYSTGCKVSTSVETGSRSTKEKSGKWDEIYVKKFSEQITADGLVLTSGSLVTYDVLKDKLLAGEAVSVRYSLRDGDARTGKSEGGYSGNYLITGLDLDGQSGDDAKYSITLQNSGAVTKTGNGLTEDTTGGVE